MSAKSQHNNILLAILGFVTVVVVVAVIGFFTLDKSPDEIQGEVEVTEYRVSSKVPGRILELRFKEGDYVKVGDTLAIIDAPELRAKAQQAQSAEAAAAAVSAKAEHGARIQQIQGAYQVWQQALAGAEIAKKSYDRVKGLYEKGVVSAQKFDEVEAQYKVAQADCAAAEQQYLLAKEGAQQEDIAAAAALVNQAGGAVAEVQSYLDDSYLIAPCDGDVLEIFAKLGDLIGTGSPVVSVLDMDDTWFYFSVREDLLKEIKSGASAQVRIPALGDQTYAVTITRVQAMASYATWRATKTTGQFDVKSFEVKAVPQGKIEGLKPGMTAILVQ